MSRKPYLQLPASETVIRVDRGIPISAKLYSNNGRKEKYPWEDLKIGDSFLFPKSIRKNTVYALRDYQRRKRGWDFEIRQTPDGIRIWRTE